jgi:hypothetical protein
LLVLAGCGGGGSGGGPAPIPTYVSSPQAKQGTLTVKIVIPNAGAATSPRLRRIYSTASATAGILFTVYPSTGTPAQAVAITGADISGDANSSCTTTGTSRTCSFSIAAPAVSTNNLLAQTYDQVVPANGVVPVGANLLAAGTIDDVVVTAGQTNTISLSLNPVVASFSIAPTPSVIHGLLPTTFSVAAYGYDAGGNIILAGTYVDQYGNPVTVTLSLSSNPNSSLALSSTTVTGSGTQITGTYHGNANITTSTPIQITASAPFTSSGTLTLVPPTVTSYSVAQLAGTPANYEGIDYVDVGGTDPQIWFTTLTGEGGVEQYDIASHSLTYTPGQAGAYPLGGGMAQATGSEFIGGSNGIYTATSLVLQDPIYFAYCGPTAECLTTSGLASASNTVYYVTGIDLIAYNPTAQTASAIATCSSTCPSPQIGGVRSDSSGNIYFVDGETNGRLYEYNGSIVDGGPIANGGVDVAVEPGGGPVFVTAPGDHFVEGFGTPLTVNESPYEGIPTVGESQYIVWDTSANALVWDETGTSGINIGRVNPQNGYPTSVPIGASGGIAGPVIQLPGVSEYAIVHYSGNANPGELLLVQP